MVFKKLNDISSTFKINEKIIAKNYILNGKLKEWKGEFFDVISPIKILDSKNNSKNFILGSYPLMDKKTALKILDNAYDAYNLGNGEWPTMSIGKRLKYFENFLKEFSKIREEIVKLLMWEIGKNFSDSQKEFDRTYEYIEKTIIELKNMATFSNNLIIENNNLGQFKRSPLGVVLCMGPYNYPLNESFTTLIPAILMGNTVIFKPPKKGVLLHTKIVEIFADIFPKGVFNILYGNGENVIQPIMETGKISVLAFIGSSKVANIIQRYHPKPNRLKLILGLEAKNAAIILKDSDIENAVNECILGSLSFNGQRCTAIKIIYLHEDIAEIFLKEFIKKINNLKIGLPFENNFITPVPYENISFYNELVKDSLEKGAKIINTKKKDIETLFHPKILYPVNKDMKISYLEQFGPIVPIMPFKNIEDVLEMISLSNYGQQCSIFGKDHNIIGNMIDVLINQVSRINLNTQCQRGPDSFPFAGRKDSAVGTLSISDALKIFSIRTLVSAKITEENKKLYENILKDNSSDFLKRDILF